MSAKPDPKSFGNWKYINYLLQLEVGTVEISCDALRAGLIPDHGQKRERFEDKGESPYKGAGGDTFKAGEGVEWKKGGKIEPDDVKKFERHQHQTAGDRAETWATAAASVRFGDIAELIELLVDQFAHPHDPVFRFLGEPGGHKLFSLAQFSGVTHPESRQLLDDVADAFSTQIVLASGPLRDLGPADKSVAHETVKRLALGTLTLDPIQRREPKS